MIANGINRAHKAFLRYAQTHPGSMTVGMLCGSTVAGLVLFEIIDGTPNESSSSNDPNQKMSPEEARLIAMLEHAKDSSWKENLENAIDAQEQFMLPGRHRPEPRFMEKIQSRSQEILSSQHERIDALQKQKEEETDENAIRYWKKD